MRRKKNSPGEAVFHAMVATVALACALCMACEPMRAQTFTVIHSFTGGVDGGNPRAGLTIDQNNNLYGTGFIGAQGGVVFKMLHASGGWLLSPLYEFPNVSIGEAPDSVLLRSDGVLYGTTYHGGSGDNGTVFRLTPPNRTCATSFCDWSATALYRFAGSPDGSVPMGGVVFDQAGNLYGSTQYGGLGQHNPGTIYQLTPSTRGSWTETQLYSFTGGADGSYIDGVIMGADGNLYGTALYGGVGNQGTVFELAHSGSGWNFQVLHTFQGGADGANPTGGLIFDQAGNVYGSTAAGGAIGGGTVFEMTPSNGGWTMTTLYNFYGLGECGPYASLTLDQQGNLWGTTYCSGHYTAGTAFKLTPSNGRWVYTLLHEFTNGADGGFPYRAVVLDSAGNAYGTTTLGGNSGNCYPSCGVVWEVSP